MKAYAVIDTNVLVSALYSKHPDAAPLQVVDHVFAQNLIPMYNEEILAEYNEVLRRPKFNFPQEEITAVIDAFIEAGIHSDRVETEESATDPKDIVFYEVAMSRDNSYLVTGNVRHFPKVECVVTPREMLEILEK